MKYCDKCKVSVISSADKCPLCQGIIEEGPADDVFPYVPTIYKKYHFFFRLLVFVSAMISGLCIFINALFPTEVYWSLFVLAAFACLLLLLRISIGNYKNIPKTILWLVVAISLLSLLWDYFTGWHGWSITYVIPIICLIGSIDLAIIVKVMNIYITDYLFYFLLTVFLGMVPAIFWLTGLVTFYYPSVICAFLNFFALMTMFFFEGGAVIEELKKRFHF